jgi:hypothetical protein
MTFSIGDLVYLCNRVAKHGLAEKFLCNCEGPYSVTCDF